MMYKQGFIFFCITALPLNGGAGGLRNPGGTGGIHRISQISLRSPSKMEESNK